MNDAVERSLFHFHLVIHHTNRLKSFISFGAEGSLTAGLKADTVIDKCGVFMSQGCLDAFISPSHFPGTLKRHTVKSRLDTLAPNYTLITSTKRGRMTSPLRKGTQMVNFPPLKAWRFFFVEKREPPTEQGKKNCLKSAPPYSCSPSSSDSGVHFSLALREFVALLTAVSDVSKLHLATGFRLRSHLNPRLFHVHSKWSKKLHEFTVTFFENELKTSGSNGR